MRALLVLVLLLLLVAAPVALAQGALFVHVAPPAGELRPDRDAPSLAFFVNVSCLTTPPPPQGSVVRVSASAPAWASLVVAPTSFPFSSADCGSPSGLASFSGTVQPRVSRDAPAHVAGRIVLNASALTATGNASGSDSEQIVAGFFGALAVNASTSGRSSVAPGGFVAVPLVVTNLGNDDVLVSVSVSTSSPGLHVDSAPALQLDSAVKPGQANATRTLTVLVRADGDARAGAASAVVRATSRDASGGAEGDTVTVQLPLVVIASRAPGPSSAIAITMVLLTAIAAGRRR